MKKDSNTMVCFILCSALLLQYCDALENTPYSTFNIKYIVKRLIKALEGKVADAYRDLFNCGEKTAQDMLAGQEALIENISKLDSTDSVYMGKFIGLYLEDKDKFIKAANQIK